MSGESRKQRADQVVPVTRAAPGGSSDAGEGSPPGGAPARKRDAEASSAVGRHGGMGHLLHIAPMALILFAPRLGLIWTLVLAAAFVSLMVWRSTRRRSAKTQSQVSGGGD